MTTKPTTINKQPLADMSEEDCVFAIQQAGIYSDRSFQDSVAWAILQGIYLSYAKNSLGHGNFKKWLKSHFPNNCYTTLNRRRKLAEAIRERLPAKSVARYTFETEAISVLSTSSKREDFLKQIEGIEEITEGKSLRELHFDYEILNRPDSRGGKRTPAKPSPGMSEEEQLMAIQATWQSLVGELYEGWENKSWSFLPKNEREILLGTIEPLVKDLRKSLRP